MNCPFECPIGRRKKVVEIEMKVNAIEKTISCVINGKDLGVIFENVPELMMCGIEASEAKGRVEVIDVI